MKLVKHLLLLLAAGYSCMAASDVKTLTLRVPEGHDDITYDADRVNVNILKHWLTLSPVLSQSDDLLVPESILACYVDDPGYRPCTPNSIWPIASNVAHTQQRIQNRLNRLNHEEFPPDFRPIGDYFKSVQSFGLWITQQEIEFFRARDISLLEKKYPALNINPNISCSSELDGIRKSGDEISEWKLVIFQWHNCLWRQFTAAAGDYPRAVWDQALKARGVREHLVMVEDDE